MSNTNEDPKCYRCGGESLNLDDPYAPEPWVLFSTRAKTDGSIVCCVACGWQWRVVPEANAQSPARTN